MPEAISKRSQPVAFVSALQGENEVQEGDAAHFEASISAADDAGIHIQWFRDDAPLTAGSRINTIFYRGHIELDILFTVAEDSGYYTCVIESESGRIASNAVALTVIGEDLVHEDLEKAIKAQGVQSRPPAREIEDRHASKEPPRFVTALVAQNAINEGEDVHLVVQVAPANDASLKVEWHKDAEVLTAGSRINWDKSKGICVLHVGRCIAEDSGDYFCVARNALGEAQTNKFHLSVAEGVRIVTKSNLDENSEAFRYIHELDHPTVHPSDYDVRYNEEVKVDSPPQFEVKLVTLTACEGGPAKFLVRVNGHPQPQLQWFLNDDPIVEDSNYKVSNDGPISQLEIHRCEVLGTSLITVLASNQFGQNESQANLTVIPLADFRPDLKHIKPENPYKKLQTLRKVELSPELNKKLKQSKPTADSLQEMERENYVRTTLYKSPDVVATEKLYDQVAANLRKYQPKQQVVIVQQQQQQHQHQEQPQPAQE